MNHVSFETAQRLKEAGFPQDGEGFYFLVNWPDNTESKVRVKYRKYKPAEYLGPVKAPTATELLPDGWYLCRDGGEYGAMNSPCSHYGERFYNENPHESAAKAQLYVLAQNTEADE